MKKVTITTDGKQYVLTFNRKTAAMYNQMGYSVNDISEKPLVAIPPFILCGFKANHPTINQKKVDEIWTAVSKKSRSAILDALMTMYAATYSELMGDDNAADEDNEGNAAAVEFED